MDQVRIDETRCTGCGLCVASCPDRVVVLTEGKARYVAQNCLLCGHCQALCPAAAIRLPFLPSRLGLVTLQEPERQVAPGKTDLADLVGLMRSRRSCRSYLGQPVPLALLEDLVRIGTTAPSGTNSQEWRFVIVPTAADLGRLGEGVARFYRRLNRWAVNPLLRVADRLVGGGRLNRYYQRYYPSVAEAIAEWDQRGVDRLFHGAVAAILIGGSRKASCPAEDALLASQNILLAAHAMGLGSCLIGFAVEAVRRDTALKNMIGLAADEELYSVIALGYPGLRFLRPAVRRQVTARILRLVEAEDGSR